MISFVTEPGEPAWETPAHGIAQTVKQNFPSLATGINVGSDIKEEQSQRI